MYWNEGEWWFSVLKYLAVFAKGFYFICWDYLLCWEVPIPVIAKEGFEMLRKIFLNLNCFLLMLYSYSFLHLITHFTTFSCFSSYNFWREESNMFRAVVMAILLGGCKIKILPTEWAWQLIEFHFMNLCVKFADIPVSVLSLNVNKLQKVTYPASLQM